VRSNGGNYPSREPNTGKDKYAQNDTPTYDPYANNGVYNSWDNQEASYSSPKKSYGKKSPPPKKTYSPRSPTPCGDETALSHGSCILSGA